MEELTEEQAMAKAEEWYNICGPYRDSYKMTATKAYRNSISDWSIKFTVEPDTGFRYFRRFVFAYTIADGVHVHDWAEDPELPDGSFSS